MKKHPTLPTGSVALFSVLVALCTQEATASQNAMYYNCATSSGCVAVENKKPTSDYTATKYPVVLAHGFSGWSRELGILDYFYGIPQVLMEGGTTVFSTKTASMNSTEVRGEQLLQQVNMLLAITGKDKVNLVGHSHGGLDARYIANVVPTKVASVTTVSSPHQGTKVADYMLSIGLKPNTTELNTFGSLAVPVLNAVGKVLDLGTGNDIAHLQAQDSVASLTSFSTKGVADFNVKYPGPVPTTYCGQPPANSKMNNIDYYSFGGVKPFTNALDISDYVLGLTSLIFKGDPNDGLVSACSSRIGYVIRDDYNYNHLDTINQFFGLTAINESSPLSVYRNQINRLKQKGY